MKIDGSVGIDLYTTWVSGEIGGEGVATQCPDIPAKLVWLKARAGNTGNVWVGTLATVTVADGTTDTTTGIELDAGDIVGPLPAENLKTFYYIGTTSADDLTYLIAR